MPFELSENYVRHSPKHTQSRADLELPYRNEDQARQHGHVLGPTASQRETAVETQTLSSLMSPAPLLHTSPAYDKSAQERQQLQSAIAPGSNMSQLDKLAQENAGLRQELVQLRVERTQTQDACDHMLTELITTQEALEETQTENSAKDAELSNLRGQLAKQSLGPQGRLMDGQAGEDVPQGNERELRELRLKCSRLQVELKRKEKQVEEERAANLETNAGRMPQNLESIETAKAQQQLADAENRVATATQLYQTAQNQADTYVHQIMGWKSAYDALQASHKDLQRAHSEASRVAQESQSQVSVNVNAVQQLQSSQTALHDAQQMTEFWKQNSEKLSKTNKEVTGQIRNLQDALDTKNREVEQQRSMIEALQLQVN